MQTEKGKQQALGAGQSIRAIMEQDGNPYNLFFYTSPYKRSRQTFEEISKAIDPAAIIGAQEEVQLREQDFGNFQARCFPLMPACLFPPFFFLLCLTLQTV